MFKRRVRRLRLTRQGVWRSIAISTCELRFVTCGFGLMAGDRNIVETDIGLLRGDASGSVRSFKGVPYAAAPVGDFRWKAPQPGKSWSGVRDALQFGPVCPQAGRSAANGASEDCLTLNIWSLQDAQNLPVIVWLHGGGWRRGAGSSARTCGENFARQRVVIVTMNFRLGILGFMAHPELSAETPQRTSSNYALLDIMAALEWVKRNISAFGGDPERVTLAGQSSGAQAVCDLMISPMSRGLFHRAIMQSAPVMRPGYAQMTMSQAEQEGRRYGENIRALRNVPAEDLLRMIPSVDYETRANIANAHYPVVDNYVLPCDERTAFVEGRFARVPVLIGNNSDEAVHYSANVQAQSLRDYHSYLKRRFAGAASEAARLYPASDDAGALYAQGLITAETSLHWGVRELARRNVSSAPTFRYLYTHDRDGRPPTHSDEIAVLFGNEVDRSGKLAPFTEDDRRVRDIMQKAWTAFAANGDPNGDRLEWRPYGISGENILEIGTEPVHRLGWRDEHIDFIGRTLRR
jgi:carboxylesterase type B